MRAQYHVWIERMPDGHWHLAVAKEKALQLERVRSSIRRSLAFWTAFKLGRASAACWAGEPEPARTPTRGWGRVHERLRRWGGRGFIGLKRTLIVRIADWMEDRTRRSSAAQPTAVAAHRRAHVIGDTSLCPIARVCNAWRKIHMQNLKNLPEKTIWRNFTWFNRSEIGTMKRG